MEYRFESVVLSWPENWLARQAERGRRFLQTRAADALELEDAGTNSTTSSPASRLPLTITGEAINGTMLRPTW